MKIFVCSQCGASVRRPTAPLRCEACGAQRIGLFKEASAAPSTQAAVPSTPSVPLPPSPDPVRVFRCRPIVPPCPSNRPCRHKPAAPLQPTTPTFRHRSRSRKSHIRSPNGRNRSRKFPPGRAETSNPAARIENPSRNRSRRRSKRRCRSGDDAAGHARLGLSPAGGEIAARAAGAAATAWSPTAGDAFTRRSARTWSPWPRRGNVQVIWTYRTEGMIPGSPALGSDAGYGFIRPMAGCIA